MYWIKKLKKVQAKIYHQNTEVYCLQWFAEELNPRKKQPVTTGNNFSKQQTFKK